MYYRWDRQKARINKQKHGVDLADAVAALEDPHAMTISEVGPEEIRYATIGMDGLGRLLVVIHVIREGHVRLISARKSNRIERREYEDLP